ncbi:hypothetical protein GG804_10280 [Sphingomonas histidinilytica]|uniref:hypothetical protein n=1 Tax=Rhizorhabdus histidinilytica TaxID=439228 RepID=UPI001ADA382F|nr:hypothetical protein [Rhizorhabdus histidinilytica]MBO9377155.1 hypothetical protein [Rhizorhabdus histidinilytica]
MEEDDNITKLPVRFRKPAPDDRVVVRPFEIPKHPGCDHLLATYIVNEREADVECGRCGTRLNPMWVLGQLASSDRRMAETREAAKLADEARRERQRCKCQHCGKMTRIRGV